MEHTEMDGSAFEDVLDRYGGDPRHWPVEVRGAVEQLLAGSPEARARLAAMRDLEHHLRETATSPGAGGTMAASAMRHPQARRRSPLARPAGWGAAIAAALVIGLMLGTVRTDTDQSPDQMIAGALDANGSVDVD
jgi:anti-sigma factor RsiW